MWKDHLPSDCPPDDAHQPNSIVYRVIDKNMPKEYDFLSHRERGIDRPERITECEFGGLSVYTDEEGVKQLKRRYNFFRKKKVCKGLLPEDSGAIKNTPSGIHKSHHTWWMPKGFNPLPLFHLVSIVIFTRFCGHRKCPIK